jgi:hypothetical protein
MIIVPSLAAFMARRLPTASELALDIVFAAGKAGLFCSTFDLYANICMLDG